MVWRVGKPWTVTTAESRVRWSHSLRFLSAKKLFLRGIIGERHFGYLLAVTLPSSPYAPTFDPATAPCAVMLPTGEQLSTSSTLNNFSSSEDGIREPDDSFLEPDDGEEYRAHHGLCSTVPIALLHPDHPLSSPSSLLLPPVVVAPDVDKNDSGEAQSLVPSTRHLGQ